MKKTKIDILFIVICIHFIQYSFAQQELTLHYLDNVMQSSYTNPAFSVEKKLIVSAPSLMFNFGNSGFTYNNIVKKKYGTNTYDLDIDNAISKLSDQNFMFTHLNLEYFNVAYKYKKVGLGVSFIERMSVSIKYPYQLASLLWNGNSQYIGEELNIGTSFKANRYRELSLKCSYDINKIKIGGRIKFLRGISNLSTKSNDLTFYTDPSDYSINIKSNYLINTANRKNFFELGQESADYKNNYGAALDLGFVYDVNENYSVSGSIIDLGFINWKSKVKNFNSNTDFTIYGLDISSFILIDTLSFESYLDTLGSAFKFEESERSYTSNLVSKFYVSSKYNMNKNTYISFLLFGEIVEKIHPAYSIAYVRDFKNIFQTKFNYTLGTSYSYKNRSFYNFGLSSVLSWEAVQIYFVGDNIFSWFFPKAVIPINRIDTNSNSERSILIPKHLKNFNFRFGINFVF